MNPWLNRVRNSNLFVRLAWGIGLGFVVLHLVYNARAAHEQMIASARTFAASTIDRALVIAELAAADTALPERLSSPGFQARLVASEPQPPDERWSYDGEARDLALRLFDDPQRVSQVANFWFEKPQRRRQSPPVASAAQSVEQNEGLLEAAGPRRPGPQLVVVARAGELWLEVAADPRSANWSNRPARAVGTLLVALLVLAIVLWTTSRVTRHFSRFADAAARLGQGDLQQSIAETGPREVRRAAAAFNEMQARVHGYLGERSAMLGAFSHDLRTLVTRVGLRLEATDEGIDERVQSDLDAITQILDEALVYSRDANTEESWQLLDLASLLETLCAELAPELAPEPALERVDASRTLLQLPATADLVVRAQPSALTRALRNLLDNALRYGGDFCIEVTVDETGELIIIDVTDPGAGIPLADQADVLKPYIRLDRSRNRATGGTGLGLAIAAQVARRHGGAVSFPEPAAGGFTVRFSLSALS